MFATVLRLEYDPNRSANIALIEYEDGERRYIIAPVGLKAGDKIISSAAADIKPGNCLPIANIPVGTIIHNIELYPGKGAQLVRSAGAGRSADGQGERRWLRSVCPPARCAIVRMNCKAMHRSGRQHRSRATFRSVRPAASVTWVGVRPSAAPS